MKTKGIIFILFCIVLSSCSKDDFDVKDPQKEISQKKLLELVNSYRQSGCRCDTQEMPPVEPVVWNKLLQSAAQKHSDDMSSNNFFSHTGSDGKGAGNRITTAGYEWTAYGENIARGYGSEETVINAWINSPDHCRNIMNSDFKEMGVARNGSYWTQVFGRR